jgi:hypothetical protein
MAVPFFLATGIRKEAFVGTMAIGALLMHITGVTTWTAFRIITPAIVAYGLLMGALMVAGTYAGTAMLNRINPRVFMYVVEALLVVIGVLFLVK